MSDGSEAALTVRTTNTGKNDGEKGLEHRRAAPELKRILFLLFIRAHVPSVTLLSCPSCISHCVLMLMTHGVSRRRYTRIHHIRGWCICGPSLYV